MLFSTPLILTNKKNNCKLNNGYSLFIFNIGSKQKHEKIPAINPYSIKFSESKVKPVAANNVPKISMYRIIYP